MNNNTTKSDTSSGSFLSSLGRGYAIWFLIVIGILGPILIGYFLYLIFSDKKYRKVSAKVVSSSCSIRRRGRWSCRTRVNYTVDGVHYERPLNVLRRVQKGDTLTIYYNMNEPSDITGVNSPKWVYWLSIGFVLFLIGFVYWWYKRTQKDPNAAAFGGGIGLMSWLW